MGRWRSASVAARRSLQPIVFSGGLAALLLSLSFAVSIVSHRISGAVVGPVSLAAFAAVPYFILLGLLRSRLQRTGILRLIVDSPDELSLREAEQGLREAVGELSR